MNFDLHLYGETPEELLNVLAHLGHMDSNYHTPIPDERHPAQAPASQPQSKPVPQPEKSKAQTSAKPKRSAQKPAAAPAEEPANPTEPASAPDEPQEPTPAQTAPSEATATAPSAEPEKDPATLDKIRDLARSLIVAGKRAGVQAAIKATGAASVSKLPPDSYTSVWEELLKLKDEVDANASN
jgi:outer membrane biosynthesis protein TonB